jgi:outer membrane biosynthesis protein TonB
MSTDLLEKAKPQPKPAVSPMVAPAAQSTAAASPAAPDKSPKPSRPAQEDEAEPSFLKRHAVKLGIATAVIAGAVYAFSGPSKPHTASAPRKAAVPVNVEIAPPPPPPQPPPPKVEPPKEQPKEDMEEQTAVVNEAPPEEAPPDEAPAVTSNGQTGNDSFGLTKGKPGGGNGGGRKLGGSGSKYGYYAGQVQSTISAAIKRHSKTKSSTMTIIARIWADETGRVTRATLNGSSGDPAVDAALRDEVLTGLQLQSPPPEGMKMPINLKLTARAPQR